MTRVLGLDLSLTATGIAGREGTLLATLSPPRVQGDQRLAYLAARIRAEARDHDVAVIEDLPTHAHGAGITGMVHGAVRVALMELGVPYVLVPPASLKKFATGRGNATKPDMRMALYRRTDIDIRDDNQVDAFWLRAMGLAAADEALFGLPQAQMAMLDKIEWPDVVSL